MLASISKNLHLTISTIIIIVVASAYGICPSRILPYLFDFTVSTTDLKQVFRAIMGLYLAMAGLWMYGIFYPNYWKTATISNVCFMGGLAFGRLIALVVDGVPSIYFSVGVILEMLLACWGLYNLKRFV